MEKIRLTKPYPVGGRVMPAGFILDAPNGFRARMVAEGRAEAVEMTAGGQIKPPVRPAAPEKPAEKKPQAARPATKPAARKPAPKRPAGKAVKRHA